MRTAAALIVWFALLVGVAGAVVALGAHGGQEVFRNEQAGLLRIAPAAAVSRPRVGAHEVKSR